jgi:hypothetical protein
MSDSKLTIDYMTHCAIFYVKAGLSFEMIMSRIWVSNLGLSSSWCRRFLFVFWKICILVLQRRNNSTQGRRRLNGRSLKAQREDSVRRTVYVSDIDQHVSELRMAWIKAYVDILCLIFNYDYIKLNYLYIIFSCFRLLRSGLQPYSPIVDK